MYRVFHAPEMLVLTTRGLTKSRIKRAPLESGFFDAPGDKYFFGGNVVNATDGPDQR